MFKFFIQVKVSFKHQYLYLISLFSVNMLVSVPSCCKLYKDVSIAKQCTVY